MIKEYSIDIEHYAFKVVTPIQKRFSDLDSFAHANNAAQQNFFDLGRAEYVSKVEDYKPFYAAPVTLLVVSYHTDFFRPILLEDEVEVCTTIYHIGEKSIKMMQVIRNRQSGAIHTVCDSVMVSVTITNSIPKAVSVPEEWMARIAEIEG